MKRIVYSICLSLIAPLTFAMFCNTPQGTNGWIQEGASPQDVIAACGQPDSQTQIDQSNKTLNTTQYWNYQQQAVQLMPKTSGPLQPIGMSASSNVLVVEINGNTIKSLASNGQFSSSARCPNGSVVRVGDTMNTLIARCGNATQTTYQYNTDTTEQPPITAWTYQSQSGQPIQIRFQNGVVSGINQ